MPTLTCANDDADDERGDHAERDPVAAVEPVVGRVDRRSPIGSAAPCAIALANSFRPPNSAVAAERHQRVREQVVEIGLQLEAGQTDCAP